MFKKVLFLFLLIFSIKVILSLFINGLIIYPDESCFFLKAKNLIENQTLSSCADLTELKIGNPFPFYSILISPIFLVFKNFSALHAIFFFNIFLSSLLVFPLFSLFNSQIKSINKSLIFTAIISLIPIFTVYERMVMSETLFLFLSLFSFHFYLKSFNSKKVIKYKILAIILAVLASITRPFGFIVPIAIAINELIITKKKKLAFSILPFVLILCGILVTTLLPNTWPEIWEKLVSLKDPSNLILVIKALKNQTNSLLFETLFVPTLIFFSAIFSKKSKEFKNIKYFLLTIIILNFIISAQHIYKYLLAGLELDLSTRYLNLSVILIYIYSFIALAQKTTTKLNLFIFAIFTTPLFFLAFNQINHALNITLSPYYKNLYGFIDPQIFFQFIFLPICFLLLILLIFEKKKILVATISTIIVFQTVLLAIWQFNYSKTEYLTKEIQFFKDKKVNILMVKSFSEYMNSPIRPIYFDYFRILTLTSNKISLLHFNDENGKIQDEKSERWLSLIKGYDFIVTPFKMTFEIEEKTSSNNYIYLNKNK